MKPLAKIAALILFIVGISSVAALAGDYSPSAKNDVRDGSYRIAQNYPCHCAKRAGTPGGRDLTCVQASGSCPAGYRCMLYSFGGFERVAHCMK